MNVLRLKHIERRRNFGKLKVDEREWYINEIRPDSSSPMRMD
jgi:hypothetical protein